LAVPKFSGPAQFESALQACRQKHLFCLQSRLKHKLSCGSAFSISQAIGIIVIFAQGVKAKKIRFLCMLHKEAKKLQFVTAL